MTIIDTSYLIALQQTNDKFHEEALKKPLWGDRFLIPAEIWVEYLQTLMRQVDAHQVAPAAHSILNHVFQVHDVLTPEDCIRLADEAQEIQEPLTKRGHGPLTIYDLVVLHLADRLREKVYTFDKAMIAAIHEGLFPGARLG